jgi:hypothetical protein
MSVAGFGNFFCPLVLSDTLLQVLQGDGLPGAYLAVRSEIPKRHDLSVARRGIVIRQNRVSGPVAGSGQGAA